MKERPILFSAPMVRAILDGRKTQTRSIVKSSRAWPIEFVGGSGDRGDPSCYGFEDPNTAQWWTLAPSCAVDSNQIPCPHGQPGDRLWVRETWAAFDADGMHPGKPHDLRDGPWPIIAYGVAKDFPKGTARPAIHMPRWASRITLEITSVRVERLQDISEADAIAEGIEHTSDGFSVDEGRHFHAARARDSFASLWDGLNEARGHGWEANPWVWVIEFRRITTEDGK
ncbi:hypothetical protein BM43_3160 [Burkholderia gladioli]|uniref:hypothetical protein n=1 Tax=Burkholderia gladioli TaxID=28095 RepID=UPI0005A75364|nr:hypothetical protein [Burkholderia gladioli]AJW97491.1 hypothetical protein BM43_3160 [Burkholderia gladioli]ASD79115.1 hypothetical protein CEJ98_08925 [Burkholderia gladioli pv. gladioli]AWY55641.1 hypothetical protein A8H28_32230 [Burkholderia gladioli pv. gladioli]SPV21766.1 Uncharacterised protein [Burkholderia gladioli]